MAMPKGFKCNNGYGTVANLGGQSFHQIAEEMNSRGYKMNHSTSRNLLLSGLRKLATKIADVQGLSLDEKQLDKISKDPRFQEGVADFIKENDGIDL